MARNLTSQGAVEVRGLEMMDKRLKTLGQAFRHEALEDGLIDGAQPIRDEARRLTVRSQTPGGSWGSGHAADHIFAEKQKGRNPTVHVAPDEKHWYIVFQEFGVRMASRKAKKQRSVPFRRVAPMRKAADGKFAEAVKEFRASLLAGLLRKMLR